MLTQGDLKELGLPLGLRVRLGVGIYVVRRMMGLEVGERGLLPTKGGGGVVKVSGTRSTLETRGRREKEKMVQVGEKKEVGEVEEDRGEQGTAADGASKATVFRRATSPVKASRTRERQQRAAQLFGQLSTDATAAAKERFKALHDKYKSAKREDKEVAEHASHQQADVPPTAALGHSSARTARAVKRVDHVVDNDEEERRLAAESKKKKADDERRERLRVEREQKATERGKAGDELRRQQQAQVDAKEAERKKKDEERDRALLAEKERKKAAAERVRKAEQPPVEPRVKPAGEEATVFKRSSAPLVLRRKQRADGTVGLRAAEEEGDGEAKEEPREVRPTTPSTLASLSLPDIPLSYSSSPSLFRSDGEQDEVGLTGAAISTSAFSPSTAALRSSASASSAAVSSATEALAKAKARIQAAKEARESLRQSLSAGTTAAQSGGVKEEKKEEASSKPLPVEPPVAEPQQALLPSHARRISHVNSLISQFEQQ